MTVILVADHAHINGGQAKVAIESALGLAARGHAVIFLAAVGPADERLAAAGIETIVLGQTDVTRAPRWRGSGCSGCGTSLPRRPSAR